MLSRGIPWNIRLVTCIFSVYTRLYSWVLIPWYTTGKHCITSIYLVMPSDVYYCIVKERKQRLRIVLLHNYSLFVTKKNTCKSECQVHYRQDAWLRRIDQFNNPSLVIFLISIEDWIYMYFNLFTIGVHVTAEWTDCVCMFHGETTHLFIISQIILAFWLVLTYDEWEDRCIEWHHQSLFDWLDI